MKKQIKRKGITLIALAITVIVMLILAGVTINLITGNNGMLFNANKSKSQTEIDEEKKILKASVLSAMGADSVANLTNDNFTNALDKNVDKQYKLEQKYDQNYGTVNPTNSDVNKEITLSSNNTGVATVVNGKVTAVKSGTATITAKTANGKIATCTVKVTTSPSGITLTKPKATLSPTGLVDTTKTVTCTSSNPSAATVSTSGLVTGKIPNQTVIITAISQHDHFV